MNKPNDTNEPSVASDGSLPAALADYKQLAKDCGVDEGIDLPVVAMAFVHGAAYGAKHPTLTDQEREAIAQAAMRVECLCQRGAKDMAATLRGLLERTK